MRLAILAAAIAFVTAPGAPAHSAPLEKEIRVEADGAVLAGTLTLPEGRPRAALLLIQGAGPHSRDQLISGAPMFKELAEGLAGAGIASIRIDNSGVGKSTGSRIAHFKERVPQMRAVVDLASQRPELAGVPFGILGHSEGSMVATEMWASRDKAIDFLVLLGAPGRPGRAVWVDQQSNPDRFPGKDAAALGEIRSAFERIADASIAGDPAALASATDRLFALTGLTAKEAGEIRPGFIDRMSSAEMAVFLRHDPAKPFALVTDPVLAVWGTHDSLTDPARNAPIFLEHRNPASSLTLIVLPNEDHFFLRGEGLPPGKHKSGKMSLSAELVETIGAYISTIHLPPALCSARKGEGAGHTCQRKSSPASFDGGPYNERR